MNNETSKQLAQRFLDAFEAGDTQVLGEFVKPDYIQHSKGAPQGLAGVQMFMGMMRGAFPDAHLEIHHIIAENDHVVAHWTMTGTQQAPFLNVPATNRPIKIEGMDIWRVQDGMLAEHWDSYDQLGMMQQLGVIPTS